MSLGTLLQTIITVIFIYLILSLLASEIQEYIASFNQFRAKRLKESIKQLLKEDKNEYKIATKTLERVVKDLEKIINKKGEKCVLKKLHEVVKDYREQLKQKSLEQSSLTESLYGNYLIYSLNQSATLIRSYIFSFLPCKNRTNRTSEGPSYIEPKLFARALLQTINDILESKIPREANNLDPESKSTIKKLERADDIDEVIGKLNSPNLRNYIARKQLIQIAKGLKLEKDNPKLDDFQAKLEELFEEAQVRSSGVYKRNAKGLSLVLGLIIAIIANADPFYIVGNLSKNNNDFRDRVVNKLDENQEQLFLDRSEEDAFGEDERELVRNILDEVGTLPLGWNYDRELKTENRESLIEVLSKKNNGNTCFDEDGEDTQPLENTACFNQFLEDIENQPHLGTYMGRDPNAKPLIEGLNYIEDCLEPKGNIDECWQNKAKNHDFPTTYTTYRQSLENQQLSQRINNIKTRNKIDFGNIINKPANLIKKSGNQIEKQGGWWQVLFGWVISAIAISMGAPFWFDLLGKVMNVRNTKKSQKTDLIDSVKEGKTSEN